MEQGYICVTCGVQQAPSATPPAHCAICEDERQYVRQGGQRWTTLVELAAAGHRIELRDLEPALTGVGVAAQVGIGQRALLVSTSGGNFLWDCVGYIDDAAIARIRAARPDAAHDPQRRSEPLVRVRRDSPRRSRRRGPSAPSRSRPPIAAGTS